MGKLALISPLGAIDAPKVYSNEPMTIRQEPFLGLAKLSARGLDGNDFCAIERAVGVAPPEAPNTFTSYDEIEIAWLAPEEWLLLGDAQIIDRRIEALKAALAEKTALIILLTHGRAAFQLSGRGARDVLSSLCPLDFHARAFASGQCARSAFGETGVFIQRLNDQRTFRIIVDQSDAAYAWRMLTDAGENIHSSGK